MKLHSFYSPLFIAAALLLYSAPSCSAELPAEQFRAAHGAFFNLLEPDRVEIRLGYEEESGVETERGSSKFDWDRFFGSVDLPIPVNEDFFWRVGFDYSARRYEFLQLDTALEGLSDEVFHRATPLLGAGWFLSENLLLETALRPGVFSNFGDGLNGDDFDLRGSLHLVYRLNPGAQLLFGARLSEDFEGTSAYPILGLRLLSEDGRLHISATLPTELRIGYNLFQPFQIFGKAQLSGESYAFQDARDGEDAELHVQDRRFGAGFLLWLGSHILLEFEGGYSFDSRIQFEFDDSPDVKRDLDRNLYLRGELGFAF